MLFCVDRHHSALSCTDHRVGALPCADCHASALSCIDGCVGVPPCVDCCASALSCANRHLDTTSVALLPCSGSAILFALVACSLINTLS